MGEIFEITCQKCKKNWELRTGCGLLHSQIDSVLKAFPDKMQNQIRTDMPQYDQCLFYFSFFPAACSQCGQIVSIPVLSFPESGNVYTGSCPTCGQDAFSTFHPKYDSEKMTEEIICPVCGSALTSRITGAWD